MTIATFKAGATISARDLKRQTGIYPQLAYAWRKTRQFPHSVGGNYNAGELIRWLRQAGYEVAVI